MSVAKAVIWVNTDVEERKRREQTGLDTLVVYAVKDECYYLDIYSDKQLTR